MPKEVRTTIYDPICPWPYAAPYGAVEVVEIVKRKYTKRAATAAIPKGKTKWERDQEKEARKKSEKSKQRRGSASSTATTASECSASL